MTQSVNRGYLEKPGVVVYNPETMRLGAIDRFSRAFLLLLGVLLIAGCGKKSSPEATDSEGYQDIENTFGDSEPTQAADREPVKGADLGNLSSPDKRRFEGLADKLPSPCGKAHSLRTSANTDKECVKASFAVDYVVELLKDGASDSDVRELFEARYGEQAQKRQGFKLDGVPHKGPSDAPVVMVEFFDYGCPSCARFNPVIEEVLEAKPTDVAVYYKMFPLASHPNSGPAAQAALAAAKQGKFAEMHELLLQNQQAHTMADLRKYAKQIGLDMQKFEADFQAVAPQVAADRKEGDQAGVMGTPTLYVNGHLYQGPEQAKYIGMWIDEQLALSR